MTTYESIRVSHEHEGRLLRVVLSRPKANIMDREMIREIRSVMEEQGQAPELSAIVFEGDGKHFSYGARVEEHTRDRIGQMLPEFHALFRHLAAPGVPLVALIRGQCLGGGFELAAFCDFLFSEAGSYMGVPEIKLGVFPPVACALLPRRIGSIRANDLLLTGAIWTAEQAMAAGLSAGVSDSGKLDDDFATWFEERLLPLSASSLRFATRASRQTWLGPFFEALEELEQLYLEELVSSHDADEGIVAFLEKRSPVWDHGRTAK